MPDAVSRRKEPSMTDLSERPSFAAVDLGSHTVRLLVVKPGEGDRLVPVCMERRVTRLAAGFQDGETLKDAPMGETLKAMREYAGIMAAHGVRGVACGATGVVRKARNGREFLELVRSETGIGGVILSEDDEAFLSAKGILCVLPPHVGFDLFFDLGGSSTEFFLSRSGDSEPPWSTSVFIGAATLTERFFPTAPADSRAIEPAAAFARDALAETLNVIRERLAQTPPVPLRVVGTAGTVTTLAAMHLKMDPYVPFRVNGQELSRDWINGTVERLSRLSLDERRTIVGLEPGREDIILGGAVIVREILNGLDRDGLIVTDGGLLEGILLDLLDREAGRPRSSASPLTLQLRTG